MTGWTEVRSPLGHLIALFESPRDAEAFAKLTGNRVGDLVDLDVPPVTPRHKDHFIFDCGPGCAEEDPR